MSTRFLVAVLVVLVATVAPAAEPQTYTLLVDTDSGVSTEVTLEVSTAGNLAVTLTSNGQQFDSGVHSFSTPAKITIQGTEGGAILSTAVSESPSIFVSYESGKTTTKASGSKIKLHVFPSGGLSFVSDRLESTTE
jgi:hypothetical protein